MWKRVSIIGWLLFFGLVACRPRGEREQVSSAKETPAVQVPPEVTVNSPASQMSSENLSASQENRDYDDLEIVTLLPRDGIPAIDNPEFLSIEEADEEYAPDELVIGVNYDGDARAYSIPYLSNHEIVNDTVGGKKIAVTW